MSEKLFIKFRIYSTMTLYCHCLFQNDCTKICNMKYNKSKLFKNEMSKALTIMKTALHMIDSY